MRIPSRAMVALRFVATLVLSALIAQAGWAAAYLGGDRGYLRHHSVGAGVTLAVCVASAVAYVVLRRAAGPVNVTLAVLLAVAVGCQYALGESGVVGVHIFVGVLIAMLGTALTSWTYRHDDGAAPAWVAGAMGSAGSAEGRGRPRA
ncbi:MAG: hypothetical protein IPK37_07900 [Austwickia sp.]|jgi:hypothetical protein|nr:MAG: hypothetical protein IPK37_07900 [Austwickia sp.]